FQQLENRQMLSASSAGNVTVALKNGSLTITGDNNSDAIEIEQVGAGQYKIFGTDGLTTINKQSTPQTFSGVTGDFNIDLKAGYDNVDFENATYGQPVTLPGNLTMKDVGNDVLNINNTNIQGNVSISGGSGSRVIYFFGSSSAGGFSLNLGSGGTIAEFYNSTIGSSTFNSGKNDCNIKLGSKDNIVEFFNTKVERDLSANISGNSGDSSIFEVDGLTVGRNATLQMGSGDDHVSLNNFTIGEELKINTGAGNDTVVLGGIDTSVIGSKSLPTAVTADQIYVDLGKGNDTLQFGGNGSVHGGGVIANTATYLGNSGVDSVLNDSYSQLFGSFTGFEQMPPKIMPLITSPVLSVLAE
ncbi:MAG TPA: hypothetical protein VMJ32_04415, partial [Pirellulales bacterium]|nr:hypothetical protein [Pirellulales bacterium]